MPTGQHCRFYIATILLTFLFALASCGPAGGETSGLPTEQSQAVATRETTASISSNNSSDNNNPSIFVKTGSQETDAKGLPVGFTEDGHPFRGDPNAPVVMEEYSDYQCPYCARFFQETLPSLEENQIANGEVVLVFYDFPLARIHPQAPAAHEAARCAGVEGAAAYWAIHDLLFTNVDEWSGKPNTTEILQGYAEEAELDVEQFTQCLENGTVRAQVQAGIDSGEQRGVNSTPSFFINGQPLTGAQPLEVFNKAIATVQDGGQIARNQARTELPPAVAPTPATINDDYAAAKGNAEAAVTIVEFTDYQCPFCSRHAGSTLPAIIKQFVESGDVHYVVKDFPLEDKHPQAREAAVAARCAGEQDAYWEMHDALFAKQPQWAGVSNQQLQQTFTEFATDLNLNTDDFRECIASGRYDDDVDSNFAEGQALGVNGTPFFFINGYPVPGAQPFELFEYAIGLAKDGQLASAYEPRQEPTQQPRPQEPIDVPIGNSPSVGDPDAPVVIVEYTDFQCPYCSRHFQQTFPLIMKNFVETGKVRYVFKDFPLTRIHAQAVVAAEAARCAHEQDAYLEMHDTLFNRQSDWNGQDNAAELFVGYAEALGLDVEGFTECLDSNRHEAGIMADLEEGIRFGVQGTPTFFINGYYVSGALPYDLFEQQITQLLAESE